MASKIIKYFLGILNDATFLSSIEYFDFKNRYISIRRDFFNLCFKIVNSSEKILKPKKFGLILKQLFINRFTSVSSTNLKKFFDNKISNSFIDYLNIARYYSALLRDDNIDFHKFFRNYLNKRNFRFYEKKGFKYYQYIQAPQFKTINFQSNSNQQQKQIILDVDKTIENYNNIIESDDDSTTEEINNFLNTEEDLDTYDQFNERQYHQIYNTTNQPHRELSNEEYFDMINNNQLPLAIPDSHNDITILQDNIAYYTSVNQRLEGNPVGNFTNYDDVESYFDNLESTKESNIEAINNSVSAILRENKNQSDIYE